MPLTVYIAPFRWYKSLGSADSYKYQQMVMDALNEWQNASKGLVSFVTVPKLHDSMINIDWRRVDRKSFGECHWSYNKDFVIYSAEVQIGLSDGIISRKYMDENEVYHTILHETGHALGLSGHSPDENDIMYTPHQYGVTKVSKRDINTLEWLYRFDIGLSVQDILSKYPGAGDIDDLIYKLTHRKSEFEEVKDLIDQNSAMRDLLQENENIGELKKYLLELNKIQININNSKE